MYLIENQKLFIWKKDGIYFTKGTLSGHPIKEIYNEDPEGFIEYLFNIYNNEESNLKTKSIIRDIITVELGIKLTSGRWN